MALQIREGPKPLGAKPVVLRGEGCVRLSRDAVMPDDRDRSIGTFRDFENFRMCWASSTLYRISTHGRASLEAVKG